MSTGRTVLRSRKSSANGAATATSSKPASSGIVCKSVVNGVRYSPASPGAVGMSPGSAPGGIGDA